MLISACGNSIDKTSQKLPENMFEKKSLFAKLSLNDSIVDSEKDLVISVSILNSTRKNQELPEDQVLKNAILSLSLINLKGDTLPSCPAVTTKNDSVSCYKRVLKPNEKYEFKYVGLNSFDPPLQKGKYKIVMSSIASNTVIIEIK